MRQLLCGECVGGPLDGKLLNHDTPRYCVPIRKAYPAKFFMTGPADRPADIDIEVDFGAYVFDDGLWRWHG